MFIYLSLFFIVIMLTFIADKNYKNKFLFYLLSVIIITFPALVAAFRDDTVGTDVNVYLIQTFINASRYNDIFEFVRESTIDSVFSFLAYISVKYIGIYNGLMFFIELFIMIFLYISIVKMRKYIPMHIAMFIYMFMFYNSSLNLMRQHMAISVCLLSFVYAFENKWIKAILLSLFSYFCHSTTFVFWGILLLYFVIKKYRKRTFIKNMFMLLLPLILFSTDFLLNYIIGIGIVSDKYSMYSVAEQLGGTSFNTYNFMSFVIMYYISLFLSKKNKNDYQNLLFVKLCVYGMIVVSLLSILSIWLGRLSLYFQVLVYVILIPYIIYHSATIKYKILFRNIIIFLVVGYWCYVVILTNPGETLPYSSILLGL